MLDAETKARIDSARDILVGKVPDPKSQVEQITIALIYKFMDDMDRQSEELGGKATFFAGESKKYHWANLLDRRLGGHERLLLYAEGIEKMNENKNIPRLFRDIFKGVFLPYRDPETLNLFLKEIDGFTYDHSERLGDAYEYLLSVLGTQGDAGQFRTPRHIIDFIIAVVDPKKHETVLDPACGTAGFLISAFKHILRNNENLTPDDRARLMTNFRGYDIAPDMVRLSRVNMYLHGFPNPSIHEYDTLTSEERWDERCDVIMANPPFMTPKGGIRPHNRFSIKAKRSEVLFVDYIAEHLTPGGRAGVIVPEGIIFQSQKAYKNLRRMLLENYLWAVVSLPAGVFNPYSGVKTSILFLDRNLAKRADDVLFVKVENDGFDLGAQRRPIEKNDLPEALKVLNERKVKEAMQAVHNEEAYADKKNPFLTVPRKRLLESPDVNLSGDRYRPADIRASGKWPMVKLGEVCEFLRGVTYDKSDESSVPTTVAVLRANNINLRSHTLDLGKIKYLRGDIKLPAEKRLKKGDIFICTASGSKDHLGKVAFINRDLAYYFGGFMGAIRCEDLVAPQYIFNLLTSTTYDFFIQGLTAGVNINNLKGSDLLSFEIPLPPPEEQERIVAELEGYRKVIEGARQVLASYNPTIRIDPNWATRQLGEITEILSGGTPAKAKADYWTGSMPWVSPKDMKTDRISDTSDHISMEAVADSAVKLVPAGAVLCVVRSGILAHTFPVALADRELAFNQDISGIVVDENILIPEWLFHILRSFERDILAYGTKRGGTVHSLQSGFLRELQIPLPPLDVQRRIVAELEAERKLVEANRALIARMEAKIRAKLADVWGDTEDAA
jgi:type I restriction enzyme M protein